MELTQLTELIEGWDFEAKRAAGRDGRGKLPNAFWESYSAMANTEGGHILLGAKELKDRSLRLDGIQDVHVVEQQLWDLLNNQQKVSVNLLRQDDVRQVEVEGNVLLLIRVPKAKREQRPVYLNDSWENGTWVRAGEGDYNVSEESARRMMLDRDKLQDRAALTDYKVTDLHEQSVQRYRELLAARNPSHPFLQDHGDDFLESIGALARDREHEPEQRYPTLAGLWMLGRENAILDRFPGWKMSYKELGESMGRGRDWVDYISADGTWNANLFQFYLLAWPRISQGVPGQYTLNGQGQGAMRGEVIDALREAFVNALIHADHRASLGVRAIRSKTGYQFINPGLLLVPVSRVWEGGSSEARNPALQRMFKLVGLCEREGSGGQLMRAAWRSQDWRAPQFEQRTDVGEVVLHLSQESLYPPEVVKELETSVGERYTSQDEIGRLVLVMSRSEPYISHSDVMSRTTAHSRDVTMKLQELLKARLLQSHGNGRALSYSFVDPALQPSLSFEKSLPGSAESSPDSGFSLPGSTQSLPGSDESSPGLDDVLWQELMSMSQHVRARSRSSKTVMQHKLVELCSVAALTSVELSTLTGVSKKYLQDSYLGAMVQEGLLQHQKSSPTDPNQRYIAP